MDRRENILFEQPWRKWRLAWYRQY